MINRGYGGWNSNGTKVLMDQIFAKKEDSASCPLVRLVTIWLGRFHASPKTLIDLLADMTGTNDSVLPPKDQTVPLETFADNLNSIMLSLTSPTSPYAIADTPLSIILITPGPCLPTMFENYKVKWRTLESTRRFKDAVLALGQIWKERSNEQTGSRGWSIETVDFWKDLVDKAGGEEEELRPFFT